MDAGDSEDEEHSEREDEEEEDEEEGLVGEAGLHLTRPGDEQDSYSSLIGFYS